MRHLFAVVTLPLIAACASATPPPEVVVRPSLATSTGHVARADGGTVAVHVGGKGDPLVVLPDGPGLCGPIYRNALAPLQERHQVVHVDWRGCGESSPARGHTFDHDVADLHAVVTTLALGKVTLLGHGYGAAVAMRYAIDHPDAVARLILVAPFVDGSDAAASVSRKQARLAVERQPKWRMLVESCGATTCTPDQVRRFLELDLPVQLATPAKAGTIVEGLRADLEAAATMQPDVQGLALLAGGAALKVPLLIIAGGADVVVGEQPSRLNQAVPSSTLVVLPQSGHWPFVEEDARFIEVIRTGK